MVVETEFRDWCTCIYRVLFESACWNDGLLGTEEQEIISPAIQEMAAKGILCYGPYPADGFMGSGNFTHFDGVLAMYHDQGLAPFKALAMDEGVNYTAGLPVIRTSPAWHSL